MRVTATVLAEGSRGGNKRITIPWGIAQSLTTPGWVRIDALDGREPFFGYARRPPSRATSVTVTLPPWRFAASVGSEITVDIEDAGPYRAKALTPPRLAAAEEIDEFTRRRLMAGMTRHAEEARAAYELMESLKHPRFHAADWLAPIPDNCFDWFPYFDGNGDSFLTEAPDGVLVVHSRHEIPFTLQRFASRSAISWLLGFYLAEGSKGPTARDWSVSNTEPRALNQVAKILDQDQRIDFSTRIVVQHSAVKARATALRVRSSKAFHRATKAALQAFKVESAHVQHVADFVLGWMEGDALVESKKRGLKFTPAGAVEAWMIGIGIARSFHLRLLPRRATTGAWHVRLSPEDMVLLLDAGAFVYHDEERARLLLMFMRSCVDPTGYLARKREEYLSCNEVRWAARVLARARTEGRRQPLRS